jgi:hypothetical protein
MNSAPHQPNVAKVQPPCDRAHYLQHPTPSALSTCSVRQGRTHVSDLVSIRSMKLFAVLVTLIQPRIRGFHLGRSSKILAMGEFSSHLQPKWCKPHAQSGSTTSVNERCPIVDRGWIATCNQRDPPSSRGSRKPVATSPTNRHHTHHRLWLSNGDCDRT